jgi:hypothetical protein
MFHWLFPPSCPCDPAAKEWVEERLEWLHDEFSDSAFTGRRIVLPTRDFFPDRYDRSHNLARALLDRVCGYMDVERESVKLEFIADRQRLWLVNEEGHTLPGAAGTYQESDTHYIVHLAESELDRPMDIVGTIAHELAHVRLLGEGRVMREIFDNELLTDLTVVHFGLGIFLANSPRVSRSQMGTWPGTDLWMPKYMSPPMFGWALAHLAWFRGEERPVWAKYLHGGARANLKQGIRYLEETGDSAHKPARFRDRGERARR